MDVRLTYPPTPARPVVDDYFGESVEDAYRWLEDGDADEVKSWVAAQNKVTRAALDALSARGSLKRRLLELLAAARQEVPVHRGPFYFYARQDGGTPQPQLMVREGLHASPRVLVDANQHAADGTVSLDWWLPSPRGRYVAYGLSEAGSEQSVLHVIDVRSGVDLADVIPGCRYASVAWFSDESGFYHTRFPGVPGHVSQQVRLHRLGRDPEIDPVVYEPTGGPELIMGVQLDETDRYVVVTVHQGSNTKTELYWQDREGAPGFTAIAPGFTAYHAAECHAGKLYIRTDAAAPRGRLLVAPLDHPSAESWCELVPEGADALEGSLLAGDGLVLEYLRDAKSLLRHYALDGTLRGEIPLPGLGTVSGLAGEPGDPDLFFSYTSYLSPTCVYRHHLPDGQQEQIFQPDVQIDREAFEERQVWFHSKDGTRVPMMLVHRKGLVLDGSHPTLLTAYGGFYVSLTPAFNASWFTWVERGGVLAIPNLRGGGEFGAAWHEAGMRERKQNVFDDFYAAAEWLIHERVTSPQHLGIEGGSNGGLLVGAALTQRPELFKAVVCAVPLLDMLRYHRFLIARYWIPEYGSSEALDEYEVLKAYSPYQHVKPGTPYPATLIVTGESDTRVDPLHARKMAALLQRDQGGPAPILLYVESRAGHGAGKPLTKRVETSSDTLGFMDWQLRGEGKK